MDGAVVKQIWRLCGRGVCLFWVWQYSFLCCISVLFSTRIRLSEGTCLFLKIKIVHWFPLGLCWLANIWAKYSFFFRAACLFVYSHLIFLSEEYWVSSRTMPNGAVGVFNGLLSLAGVCYSVTVEKSMLLFFSVFLLMFLTMHHGHLAGRSERWENIWV